MHERVAIATVVRETVNLLGRKMPFAALVFLPMLAVTAPIEWMGSMSNISQEAPGGWWCFLFFMLLGTVAQVACLHYFIQALQGGEPRAIPGKLLVKTVRTLLKEVTVLGAVFIPGAVALSILAGLVAVFHPEGGVITASYLPKSVQAIYLLGVYVFFGWPFLRLGAGVVGAAVGEKVIFRESWAMTRKHSFSLLFFFSPLFFIPVLVQWMLIPESGSHTLFSLEIMVQSVVSTSLSILYYAGSSVWYVRLRDRHGAMETPESSLSPWAVASDAVQLIRLRSKVYLSALALTIAAGLPAVFMLDAGALKTIDIWVELRLVGLSMLVWTGVYLTVCHDSLSTLRGETGGFPPRFFGKALSLFGKVIQLCFILFGMGVLLALGLVIIPGFLIEGFTSHDQKHMLEVLGIVACYFIVGIFWFRLGLTLPAISVGGKASFRRSWRMSKGHAVPMATMSLPAILCTVLAQGVVRWTAVAGTDAAFTAINMLFIVIGGGMSLLTMAVFIVWYEKLRLHSESSPAAATPEEASSETSRL